MGGLALLGLGAALLLLGGGSRGGRTSNGNGRAARLSALDRELVRFARSQRLAGASPASDAQLRELGLTQIVALIDASDSDQLRTESERARSAGYPQIARFLLDALVTRGEA